VRQERPSSASEAEPLAGRRPADDPSKDSAAIGRPSDGAAKSDEPKFFADPKRIVQTLLAVVLLVIAIYVLFPKVIGLDNAIDKIGEGEPFWIGAALLANVLAFAAYVTLFRGVIGERLVHLEWRESYQITMAGLSATRLFSAGGAGGIVLTYWALRKAGMPRRRAVCRMIAFLVVLYVPYLLALVVFGVLLETGVLPGESPLSMTIIPAALAAAAIVIVLLLALVPEDFERRIEGMTSSGRFGRLAQRLATAPATFAQGTRTAIAFVRHPSQGGLAVVGAIGFWAANIAILWASFQAFDVAVPFGVVVQGFFVGMVANLFPLAPGGVGAVDAGMIGAFVIFGLPEAEVFVSVLSYRAIAFWLPIPPGIVAFFQLRRTVHRWEQEGREAEEPLESGGREAAARA